MPTRNGAKGEAGPPFWRRREKIARFEILETVISAESLALENLFVRVQDDLLRFDRKIDVELASTVAQYGNTQQRNHAFAEVSEDWNQHGKVAVNSTLSERYVKFRLVIGLRLQIVREGIFRSLRAINPFVEEPIESSIVLQVHLLRHVLLCRSLERFRRSRTIFMRFHEVL